jgi:DHA2 family multidrug resistance protein
LQEQRTWLHSRRIEEAVSANTSAVQDYIGGLTQSLGSVDAAMLTLAGQIQQQALVMTYGDLFFMLTIGILCVLPLVLFLRPLPRGDLAAMH